MLFLSSEQSSSNPEEELKSAISPPTGQEASLRLQCNGLTESSCETARLSENNSVAVVLLYHQICQKLNSSSSSVFLFCLLLGSFNRRSSTGDGGVPEPSGSEEGAGEFVGE